MNFSGRERAPILTLESYRADHTGKFEQVRLLFKKYTFVFEPVSAFNKSARPSQKTRRPPARVKLRAAARGPSLRLLCSDPKP